MSDTMSCPNCSATLPAGAAFCTSCGTRIGADAAASAAPAAPAPPEDATRVDNPGLHDATQVFTPPAPAYEPPAPPSYEPPGGPRRTVAARRRAAGPARGTGVDPAAGGPRRTTGLAAAATGAAHPGLG
ncbi:zinc ribbon domain-containing protein [Aquihabitans sp. G128]|uniref:zinc-ribbon domain-containing protein n=1 Tax=Aquihabitans sp. G128 TaxID=2849779 RepID=UPI001C23709D|nr:zinc-ribbon domain-containing protein [Aquihabitans sp. G128]QXC61657.1 zinc ribbon domain-containing protein [Aquihabitans sp. G128]